MRGDKRHLADSTRFWLKSSLMLWVAILGSNTAQAVVVNEFMAANTNAVADPQGQFDDWIELYNPGSDPIDVGGWYLTDDVTDPTQWRIPNNRPDLTTISAQGFLIIWADGDVSDPGLHANFGLRSGGEQIGLFGADGQTLIDVYAFGAQTANLSMGRHPDGGEDWRVLTVPSPGASNQNIFEGVTAPVSFSVSRGFYQGSVSVALQTATEGATILYTLDGRHPLEHAIPADDDVNTPLTRPGIVYASPLDINTTTCLRAVAIKPDWQDSPVITHTYIFLDDVAKQSPDGVAPGAGWPQGSVNNQVFDYGMDPDVVNDPRYTDLIEDSLKAIPTVSLVTDLAHLFDEDTGIYVHPQSEGRRWERPVSVELIHPDDTVGFHINAGLRIRGGSTGRRSDNPKHAFRLLFRPEYGAGALRYPLFGDEGVDTFSALDLRTSQNYSWSLQGHARNTMVREVFSRDVQGEMGQPYTRSRYYHLYLNGQYWGLYQSQERAEASFAASYLGGDENDYDAIKTEGRNLTATDGNKDAYRQLYDLAQQGFSDPAAYWQAQGRHPDGSDNPEFPTLLDVNNLMDYMIIEYLTGDRDGPGSRYGNVPNNTFGLYNRVNPDGFKWFQHESEHSLGTGEYNLVQPFTNAGNLWIYFNPHWLHERLANTNETYRDHFTDRVHRHFFNEGPLTPSANQARIQARADQIDLAIVAESARWGDAKKAQPYTREDWRAEIDNIINTYLPERTNVVINQFRSVSWYPDLDAPVFHIDGQPQHGGSVAMDAQLEILNPGSEGTVYYSLDGVDPRDAELPEQQLDTLVPFSAEKRALIPDGPVDAAWRGGESFDDSGWLVGTGHIGYDLAWNTSFEFGLDVEDAMWDRNASCYVRSAFDIDGDPSLYQTLRLLVWYDDGFIAYLNGNEILVQNAPETPAWDSHATHAHEGTSQPETFDVSDYSHVLRSGTNILALHGLNASKSSTDFLVTASLEGIQTGSSVLAEYTGPVSLTRSAQIRARTWHDGQWSGLNEAFFAVDSFAGLRVSEIMYHPASGPRGDEADSEYIELANAGDGAISLNRVRLSEAINFAFPDRILEPGQTVLVVRDLQAFTAAYGAGLPVAGQYQGRLSNRGERLVVQDPEGQILIDLRYSDGSHPGDFANGVDAWPRAADGLGSSLGLLSLDLDGQEAEHWQAVQPTPGRVNTP